MSERRHHHIFEEFDPHYKAKGLVSIPVAAGAKQPAVKNWAKPAPSDAERTARRKQFATASIGILAGTPLIDGHSFGFVDIDDPGYVAFVKAVLDPFLSGKKGKKGLTIFCQAVAGVKSAKLRRPGGKAPSVEIFSATGQTVLPPSVHPSGSSYVWEGKALLEIELSALPILTEERAAIIKLVVRNKNASAIVEGAANVKAHDLMLSLAASGVANLTADLPWLAECLNALFHPDYQGDTREQTLGMLESAKRKKLGALNPGVSYNPGSDGPIPLGFTKEGNFALRDQVRNIIVVCSANQLLSPQYLVGLNSSSFWREQFPSEKGFSALHAGEALITGCKAAGPFFPAKVRGRGIWREGDRIIINLGQPVPYDVKYSYLCFEPVSFKQGRAFPTDRLLAFLQKFNWRGPQDAILLLGWLAMAPICGVLNWRPHVFVYGPARCGKTTIHTVAARLLQPLVISTDGQSSEAGIRQTLGPDSLPIVIDEFESDHHGASIRNVLRLARSASSADNPVLRGTPEGKAMQFSLRTTFFFCAVNPSRMSPADQTRILVLELKPHNNDREVAQSIIDDEAFFRDLGPEWCGYMISRADQLGPAVNEFEGVLPSFDRRHRQNFAVLLGAAFLALKGRPPTHAEAEDWAKEFEPSIERHAEDIERDNAVECLDHLLAHVVDDFPLGHWIATACRDLPDDDHRKHDAERISRTFDIVVHRSDEHEGIVVRNGSPNIEKIFRDTVWGGRGWERALRALDGAFSLKNPVYFGGGRGKSRCIGIPASYIPDPIPTPADGNEY